MAQTVWGWEWVSCVMEEEAVYGAEARGVLHVEHASAVPGGHVDWDEVCPPLCAWHVPRCKHVAAVARAHAAHEEPAPLRGQLLLNALHNT